MNSPNNTGFGPKTERNAIAASRPEEKENFLPSNSTEHPGSEKLVTGKDMLDHTESETICKPGIRGSILDELEDELIEYEVPIVDFDWDGPRAYTKQPKCHND